MIGCGGDRDRHKRPLMAETAYQIADKLVLTTDNPRNEDPETILDEMWAGLPDVRTKSTLRIADRRTAIRTACREAKAGDVVVIAGKGHEAYQEIKGQRVPFSDFDVVSAAFSEMDGQS